MRCRRKPTTTAIAGTSHRSAPNGRARWRRTISTGARSRSMAVRTRFRRISSPKPYWDCERLSMDFSFTDEQRLLKESIERLLADRYSFEARQPFMDEPAGWSRALWRRYAELGLLGLPFEDRHGGVGGGPVETMIVMEAFGRALALEPFFATVVLAGGLLRLGADEAMRAAVIPKIASGDLLLAFAHAERQSRYDLADIATTARRDGADYILDGAKSLVIHGDCADRLIVSARLAGARRDREGLGLFGVDAGAAGGSRRAYPTGDGQRAAEAAFSRVRLW